MSTLSDILARPGAVLSIISVLAIFVYKTFNAKSKYPDGLPWVGRDPNKWFAGLRANFASFSSAYDLLAEGYEKHTKKGRSYLIPDASGISQLLLPRSQMPWVLNQPDEILSSAASHYDTLGEDYAFTHKNILRDAYHEHVIHKYLPRRLPAMIPDLQDEVAVGFDDSWGTDTTQWREIKLYDSVMFMLSRAVNRMIVGLPLCRNEVFLENTRSFAMAITGASFIIGHSPDWLKPIVGRLATLPNNTYYRRCAKYTIPLITERKAKLERKKNDPDFKWEPPNDFISWTILLAEAEGRHDEATIDMISRRVMPIEFASIHTSSITITHCLFDLLSTDPTLGYLEAIRQESVSVLGQNDGQWNKAALAQCHLADSALRESMRISNFMSRNIVRKVMPENGITNPSEGWHAPKGTYVGFDMHNVQHDPDIYPNPNTYEAFRFAPPAEAQPNGAAETSENGNVDEKSTLQGNTGVVTTSDIWFPFSRGKHTCPGRFLIAAEAKILLAYMTMHYDIEPLASRPKNLKFGQMTLPPQDATIKVRRKKNPVTA